MTKPVKVYQLPSQSISQTMSYILQDGVGHMAVIDGGTRLDAPYLLSMLEKLGGPHPHVEAWFFTHPHVDHIDAFTELMEKAPDALRVDALYYHFPHEEYMRRFEGAAYRYCTQTDFLAIQPKIAHLCRLVHPGDCVTVGDMLFTVLQVPDENITTNVTNNSSVVIRCDTPGGRVLFLGDLGVEGGEKLLRHHTPEELQADVVQMAHHGQNGVDRAVYAVISPRVCLWPTPAWLWDNDGGQGPGSGPFQTTTVRRWMDDLQVKRHLIDKDGLAVLELPLTNE